MTFFDGPSALSAPVTLTNGQGAFTVSTLSVGTHAITAQYSGDAQNKPGTSSTLQQVITGSTQFQLVVNGGGQTTTINMRALIE
jgi:Big-like domain-containing protein